MSLHLAVDPASTFSDFTLLEENGHKLLGNKSV
jgi:hypothetical protein